MTPLSIHLFGLAAAVFITTGLVVAAVRWFHMCPPFDKNPRYYYPGRPFVVGIYLNALVLIPYAIHPESADAWFLARIYFFPVTLFHCIVLLFSYFGIIMHWRQWRLPLFLVGGPVAFFLLAVLVLAVWPGEQFAMEGKATGYILYSLGAITTLACLLALQLVLREARRIDMDEYSNPDDFPVVSARRWMLLVMLNLVLCWTGALSDNRVVLAAVMLLLAASALTFLITVLRPNRNRQLEDETAEVEAVAQLGLSPDPAPTSDPVPGEPLYQRNLSFKKRLEILSAVTTVVEEQEAFLDPHLTLQQVAERSGYNRSYVAGLIKSELGGFFTYVNRLRIAHVETYMRDHPSATVEEATEMSGFLTRKAYYSAKSKLQDNL
jgi:AraC-like DNA-binding protein